MWWGGMCDRRGGHCSGQYAPTGIHSCSDDSNNSKQFSHLHFDNVSVPFIYTIRIKKNFKMFSFEHF